MKGLIVKDFINLKKNFKIFGVVSIIYLIIAITSRDASFFSSIITMLFGMLALSLYSYDDLAKWDVYALTMPVSKENMVRSKYVMMILLTLVGVAYSVCVSVLLNVLMKLGSMTEDIQSCLLVGLIILLIYSFILPFITKLGVEKSRLILLAAIMIPFALFYILDRFLSQKNVVIPQNVIELVNTMLQYANIILTLVAVAALGISYRISVGIYEKKEF